MKHVPTVGAAAMVAVIAIACLGGPAANATEAPGSKRTSQSAENVAHRVEAVAPHKGDVRQVGRISARAFASANVILPIDAGGDVVVAGDAGDVPLSVSLPREAEVKTGQQASDGTVVYPSSSGAVDVATQVLGSGTARMQTVINGPRAAHTFTYSLGGGYTPTRAADGAFWAYSFGPAGEIILYSIGAAWARDANGSPVPTHYEIKGRNLVQVVSTRAGTAYPVVADPTWQWYSAAYGAGFSKKETRNLANTGAITGFCVALGKWPPLAIGCAIAGAQWFLQAGLASNAKACVFIAAVPAPLAVRWTSSQCK